MQTCVFILLSAAMASGTVATDSYPKDVAQFIEQRDGCDHFRGEEAYDAERGKFLAEQLQQLCTGTDKKLARLKSKYRANRQVMAKLGEYEERIESPSR